MLPVLLFHGGITSGGYIGVDVFFVISGYLICGIILRGLVAGNFSFADFYERRARRILPALYLVSFISIGFAYCLMTPAQLINFGKSLIAVATFTSNFLFNQHNNGYFASPLKLVPLLHTWSLAVEEQFYIMIPLIFVLIWKYLRSYLRLLLIVMIVSSLGIAQILAIKNQSANFFLLPSRMWELMLGALLARHEILYGRQPTAWLRNFLPSFGLAAIIFSVCWFTDKTLHPSLLTLIPVIGTSMIIWYAGSNDLVTRILTTRTLVGIGLISYSVYLWHLPILVFYRMYNGGNLSFTILATYIPLSILLAYCSWRWVEKPSRNRSILPRKYLLILASLTTILLILLGYLFANKKIESNFVGFPYSVGNSFMRDKQNKNCNFNRKKSYCALGKEKPQIDFVAIGDSHANFAITALRIAAQETGAYGIASTLPGCAPIYMMHSLWEKNAYCVLMSEKMFNFVHKNKIKNVILIARWSAYEHKFRYNISSQHAQEIIKLALTKTVQMYNSIGARVFIILQVPEQKSISYEIYKEVFRANPEQQQMVLEKYSTTYVENLAYTKFFNQMAQEIKSDDLVLMDLSQQFCSSGICLVGTIDHSYYRDYTHLSKFGAEFIAPQFVELFEHYGIGQ